MTRTSIWPDSPDPFLFLEAFDNPAARGWVDEQNARTHAAWCSGPLYDDLLAKLERAFLPSERPVIPARMKDWAYDVWTDADNPKGLWRRTSWASWRDRASDWRTLVDFDALGRAEGTPWMLSDLAILHPDGDRALILLSPDGGDSVVVREFDIERRRFVRDGFVIEPAGKHAVEWIDRDTVYVGWDGGDDTVTRSGYPREVRRWVRGTSLADSPVVFRGEFDDVSVDGAYDPIEQRHTMFRDVGFQDSHTYHLSDDGNWTRYDVPAHVAVGAWNGWLLLQPRLDWTCGGSTHANGGLLAVREQAFLAGNRDFVPLFKPTGTTSACEWTATRHYLIVSWLDDVQCRNMVWQPRQMADGNWSWHSRVFPVRDASQVSLTPIETTLNDEAYVYVDDCLQPPEYSLADLAVEDLSQGSALELWPAQFDADSLAVRRDHALSRDGTRVAYTVMGPRAVLEGTAPMPCPCLLTGYGGFAVPLVPGYDPGLGVGWLERNGVAVIAHIRGGGEFGADWHTSAQREHRQRAFDDFIAVAEKLIADGMTTPAQLGIQGGSNGGLLVAACMVQRPALFGAVVCQVPLLDMERYHLLHAGASWLEEFGDPDDPDHALALAAYSPYHCVIGDATYPPVLFVTSTSDDRVHPGHARKMVARMQAQGHPDVWLLEKADGGHGSVDGLDAAQSQAVEYNFLWGNLRQ
ncbi:prolyl oligopeptidase family serine peptidase [Paraburkholderia terrae]|uniref:S9 family peptidase n=1 Tax=Paraburkholderia terrae TaxID=311230 RepID=A0A2I8EIL1_9BURK|nr:prolyl oligopeptidase family serine peptidase [Paraburkholderia terrae]AUT59445.1 S9 family peptidase [Paraburkholderia terrae]